MCNYKEKIILPYRNTDSKAGGSSKRWVGVVKGVVVSFSKGSSKIGFFGPGGGSKKKPMG